MAPERIIYFDLETTGYRGCNKYSNRHKIIQFAALEVMRDGEVFFSEYVNPGIPILPRSTAFHHITNAMVVEARPLGEVWAKFRETYQINAENPVIMVAHNSHSFDRVVLAKELYREGVPREQTQNIVLADSLLYFRHLLDPSLRESIEKSTPACSKYNLANLHQYFFGEPIPNAHDAGADVTALARVCSKVPIDWENYPYYLGLEHDASSWVFHAPLPTDDIIKMTGIGPSRRKALQRAFAIDEVTVERLREVCGQEPWNVERLMRLGARFDDDALVLELVAHICQRTPLQLLVDGYPFCRGIWGSFHVPPSEYNAYMERGIKTIQELVEATLYDEQLKQRLLDIPGNERAYGRHSFRLKT